MKEQALTAIVQTEAQASNTSMKMLAAELDKAPSTLYQQLNPYDFNGRLGVEDAHDIMKMVGSISLVEAMAADFNCRVECMDAKPDGEDMRHEQLQAYEAVGLFIQAVDKGFSSKELYPLLERAVKELQDVWTRLRDDELTNKVKGAA